MSVPDIAASFSCGSCGNPRSAISHSVCSTVSLPGRRLTRGPCSGGAIYLRACPCDAWPPCRTPPVALLLPRHRSLRASFAPRHSPLQAIIASSLTSLRATSASRGPGLALVHAGRLSSRRLSSGCLSSWCLSPRRLGSRRLGSRRLRSSVRCGQHNCWRSQAERHARSQHSKHAPTRDHSDCSFLAHVEASLTARILASRLLAGGLSLRKGDLALRIIPLPPRSRCENSEKHNQRPPCPGSERIEERFIKSM